eukprot:3854799-Pyramimonas_sp.AAC.1
MSSLSNDECEVIFAGGRDKSIGRRGARMGEGTSLIPIRQDGRRAPRNARAPPSRFASQRSKGGRKGARILCCT